jgi:hypothetical protein
MKQRLTETPPPVGNTSPSMVPGAAVSYTLASLTQRLGAAERPQVLAYVAHAPIATLVEEGSRVNTDRLVTEGVRVVGLAVDVLGRADEGQRMLMPALGDAMLRACVGALSTCQSTCAARVVTVVRNGAQVRQRKGARGALAEQVVTQREIVYTAAVSLAGHDPARTRELDEAWGSGDDPKHLATSLAALVVVTRAIAADARKRGVAVTLTEAWLAEQEALAAKLLKQAERAAGHASDGDVGQGDLDWWRGVALWLLKQVVDAVDVARKADPRIRAIPLGTLRNALKRSGKPKRKAPAPPAPPAPPA